MKTKFPLRPETRRPQGRVLYARRPRVSLVSGSTRQTLFSVFCEAGICLLKGQILFLHVIPPAVPLGCEGRGRLMPHLSDLKGPLKHFTDLPLLEANARRREEGRLGGRWHGYLFQTGWLAFMCAGGAG